MSLDDVTTLATKSDEGSRLPAERVDARQLVFFNVDKELERGVSSKLSKLYNIDFINDLGELQAIMRSSSKSIDAVLVGATVSDPVSIIQQIYAFDKQVPTIISCTEPSCAQLRAELRYIPFVGHEVLVWPTADIEGVAAVLSDAAQRRQQRQRYHEAALANAHVQLEVLPLLQPEAAEYIEGILDHEPIGALATDLDGRLLTANRQARQILALDNRRFAGLPLETLFPKADRERIQNLLDGAAGSDSQLSPEVFELPTSDHDSSFVEVSAAMFSDRAGQRGVMLILQEVTHRVQAENQRAEAVVELRLISRVLHAFHAISTGNEEDLSDKVLRILNLGCEQFGLPIGVLSQVESRSLKVLQSVSEDWSFVPGSERPLEETYCAATINSTEPLALEDAGETRWRNHSVYKEQGLKAYLGVRIFVEGTPFGTLSFMSEEPRGYPFTAAERETLKLMSQWISGEIERERAEAHMRKLSSAIEQIGDSVVITSPGGLVEYVNPSFEDLTGYVRSEVVGRPTNFLPIEEELRRELWDALEQGKNFEFVLTDHTKSGSLYHEQITISPIKDNAGAISNLIATGRDITETVDAREMDRMREAELAHVARLSTLGGMVSGLSHELNQPLCAITTYAQTCLRKIEPGDERLEALRHGLDQIVSQAERANDIFERIRNFSRKREWRRQRIDIIEIVESVLGFVETEMRNSEVKVDIRAPKKKRYIYVDTVQIQQVLLNLVRNSLDAMSGDLKRPRNITIAISAQGRSHTKVTVTDTGVGCPNQEVVRVFEPFFTTKESGLGVGLSISQSIVETHGGELWLQSSSDQGASFCMTVPNWRSP